MVLLDKLAYFFENLPLLLASLLSAGLLAIFFRYKLRRLHYESPSVEIVQSFPPRQYSPAALRYIWKGESGRLGLIALLLNAAVKRCYRIQWSPQGFSLRLKEAAPLSRLAPEERAALFPHGRAALPQLRIGKQHSRRTTSMGERLDAALQRRSRYVFFPVLGWIAAALGFSLAIAWVLLWLFEPGVPASGFLWRLLPWAALPLLMLLLQRTFPGGLRRLRRPLSLLFIAALVLALYAEYQCPDFPRMALPAWLPMASVCWYYLYRLPIYSPEGFRLYGEIESFRNFLSSKVRLNAQFEADEFELLPCLVALETPFPNTDYFNRLLVLPADAN